jgi:hypothetical protein
MGHEFSITATLKGAVGETLLTEHKEAVREYFSEWCLENLEEHNQEWIPDVEYRVSFDIERPPHSYDISIDGSFATWYPDGLYTLTFEPAHRVGTTFDRYRVEFPIEVKTGNSSELSANQRAVMATLEQQPKPIVPLRVRVDVSEFPSSFSATPCRVQQYGDEPLPEYDADNVAEMPSETSEDTEATSLTQFIEAGSE